MGKWITYVCPGGWRVRWWWWGGGLHRHAPAQGQTQCVISVPGSDTRCQWNVAECARVDQRKFLCFLSEHTVE